MNKKQKTLTVLGVVLVVLLLTAILIDSHPDLGIYFFSLLCLAIIYCGLFFVFKSPRQK